MIFDYSKLNGKIKEQFKNRNDFCKLIHLSANSLSKKINNKVPFTSYEIYRIVEILGIDINEIGIYFYTIKVENIQQI
jgi:hypothetical protein